MVFPIFDENHLYMMRISVSVICFLFAQLKGFSQEISYSLSMPHPETHYFQVKMTIRALTEDTLRVKMPVWAPGSYLIREFPANVNRVYAKNEKKQNLPVNKITKNAWQIILSGAKEVELSYDVYAFELSVRTSYLDLEHGYINGTSIFMYLDGAKEKSGTLSVFPYEKFTKISTALPVKNEGIVNDGNSKQFVFKDYDQLVDCPIEIGNQTVFDFTAAGVRHTVAIFGEGNFEIEKLKVDMAKIVEEESRVFGENPNKEYLFIVHNVSEGGGGLEHKNSTTLSVNRDTYDEKNYIHFLDVMAHEYFHLWNVKRLRPIALGPFNYGAENYTHSLWFSEGFTSYYADLFLRRAGFYTDEQFTNKLISGINYIENTIGSKIQPVADASFDAWIKSYRPNENSGNTTVSYYTKGRVLGAVFDAMIIAKYNGEKCLDDFMKMMYEKYALSLNRGFTDKELEDEFSKFIGEDIHPFFDRFIYDTKTIDYSMIFEKIGFDIQLNSKTSLYFGANMKEIQGGPMWVRTVDAGSPAEAAGISPNDVLIHLNDSTISEAYWNAFSRKWKKGNQFHLSYVRDGLLKTAQVTVGEQTRPVYSAKKSGDKQKKSLYSFWVRSQKQD
jgi:predicted metalloprotease with PDZ domain